MKTILITLLLTGLGLAAQTPPPGPTPALPTAPNTAPEPGPNRDAIARRQAAAAAPTVSTRKTGALPPAGSPPAMKPAASGPGAPGGGAVLPASSALGSGPAGANASAKAGTDGSDDDMVPPGMLKLQKADLDQVLLLYSSFVGRTILRPATLPTPQITFMAETPLTKHEAVQALDAVLGMNGVGMIPVGEKFVKAVPIANVNQQGAPFGKELAEDLPEMGQYVTHIVQLKYVKPTEMMQALTPFASAIPTPILAVDGSQILILRDFAENVKRMLELITKIDVNVPSEFVSEVIPISTPWRRILPAPLTV